MEQAIRRNGADGFNEDLTAPQARTSQAQQLTRRQNWRFVVSPR
jgi:hypothetical protein